MRSRRLHARAARAGNVLRGPQNRIARDRKAVAPAELDEQRWRRTTPAVAIGGEVSLRGLGDRVVAEMLFGLQQRVEEGRKTPHYNFRKLADHARLHEVRCVGDIDPGALPSDIGLLVLYTRTLAGRQQLNPETERLKDEWDATVFGCRGGTLRFTSIVQPWLREAAKVWAYDDLPRRRGVNAKTSCQTYIRYLGMLSESLCLQRVDNGARPAALGRTDIDAFRNRLAFLQAEGVISIPLRTDILRGLRSTLARMRSLGLTRVGQPLHGLPDDFAVRESDVPSEPEDCATGKDLPPEVLAVICRHLDELEMASSPEIRIAVELLIDTGRRPEEICQLGFDCLERDEQDKPVLIYDNFKANRLGRHLPIQQATAALIDRQRQRVRDRFPDTPRSELKLLPAATRNPYGKKAIGGDWVGKRHRAWITALPEMMVRTVIEVDGRSGKKMEPFDKQRIFLYAYRHSWAQRHADAGVPVNVLRELMDHRQMDTTQTYYSVGEKRRRDAVDRVTAMQFDRHGNRVWQQAKALLDSEYLRRAVGSVAVPYGTCSEPSNVAAGGDDCPVRFRCIGCAHFSTDVSYLPDLEAYLADLLRSRERLRGAFTAADSWAKTEAMPSDEEISRIRRLISRVKAEVDDLSPEDRTQIEEAVGVVRRARSSVVGLGLPRIPQPIPDIRPDRSA